MMEKVAYWGLLSAAQAQYSKLHKKEHKLKEVKKSNIAAESGDNSLWFHYEYSIIWIYVKIKSID